MDDATDYSMLTYSILNGNEVFFSFWKVSGSKIHNELPLVFFSWFVRVLL